MTEQPTDTGHRTLLPLLGGLVLLAALPIVLVVPETLSVTAWLITAALWTMHMLIRLGLERLSTALPPTMALGVAGIGMMLRVWTAAIAIFVIGADTAAGVTIGFNRPDLAVSVLILFAAAFTVDVVVRALTEARRHSGPASMTRTASLPKENDQ